MIIMKNMTRMDVYKTMKNVQPQAFFWLTLRKVVTVRSDGWGS